MPRHNNAISRLGEIQRLDQQPQENDVGNLVKMLGALYDIHTQQQEAPDRLKLLQQQAGAYERSNAPDPDLQRAKQFQLESTALDKMFPDYNSPEHKAGAMGIAKKMGLEVTPPVVPLPPDAMGGVDPTKPVGTVLPPSQRLGQLAHMGYYANPASAPLVAGYDIYNQLHNLPDLNKIKQTAKNFLTGFTQ